jgi:hypothetical protein
MCREKIVVISINRSGAQWLRRVQWNETVNADAAGAMQMHAATLWTRKELFRWPHQTKTFRKKHTNLCWRKNAASLQVIYHVTLKRLRVFGILSSYSMDVTDNIAGDVLQRIRIVRRKPAAP